MPMYGGGHAVVTTVRGSAGLELIYLAEIYERGQKDARFNYYGRTEAVDPEALTAPESKMNFYSAEYDRNGSPTILKDGFLDDRWVVDRTLRKFAGYRMGLTEKVDIGGEFFEELASKGY